MFKKHAWKALVAIACALVLFFFFKPQKTVFQYDTVVVDKGDIVSKVTASGVLAALVTVQVGSQVSGRVQQVLVDYNSPVKKGQTLAVLDPALFEAAYDQAKANVMAFEGDLKGAQAKVFESRKHLERVAHLAEQKLVGDADVDNAQVAFDVAQAQVASAEGRVAQARAQMKQAKANLSYTVITSPVTGMVVSRSVDAGQTVAASLQSPTLFVIVEDLKKMQVDTSVSESDVGRVREGMVAVFTVDAFPDRSFEGRVRQVRHAPQTVQNVVTYNAVIDVDNEEVLLKPGMTANVSLVVQKKEGVVRVPQRALRFQPPSSFMDTFKGHACVLKGGDKALWVLKNTQPHCVVVRVGFSDGVYALVQEGVVQEGDVLLVDATDMSQKGKKQGGMPSSGGPMRRVF